MVEIEVRLLTTAACHQPDELPAAGAPGMNCEAFRPLRATLTKLHGDADGRAALISLCLSRFLAVEPAAYTTTLTLGPAAMRNGYRVLR